MLVIGETGNDCSALMRVMSLTRASPGHIDTELMARRPKLFAAMEA